MQLGSADWAGCVKTSHPEPCPESMTHFRAVNIGVTSGKITVLYYKGHFIATVCGNYSRSGVAGPIPTITGTKYEDLNANGKRDSGEPGLGGWTIKLRHGGTVVATTKTASNGHYSFSLNAEANHKIGAGGYTVEEVLKSGWHNLQKPGAFKVPFGAEGHVYAHKDFGNYRNATIAGHKFDDSDVSGDRGAEEVGLPEWTIGLSNGSERSTDAEGAYSFSVKPGTYTVGETLQPGWRQTTPGETGTRTYTVVSGQAVADADFGNVCLGGVTVSPVDESTEEPVPMEVRLEEVAVPGILDNEPSLPRTTSGAPVSFGGLLPGTYLVTAYLPEGVFTTDPDAVPVGDGFAIVKEVTVPECESAEVPLSVFTHSTPGKVTGGPVIGLPGDKFATGGFQFQTKHGAATGTLQYVDHDAGLNLHTSEIEAIHVDGEVAVVWGKVLVGGVPERFRLRLVDAGEPGTADRFEITLADGYARGGTLTGGNIQIHDR
jgi:hypothetical protein